MNAQVVYVLRTAYEDHLKNTGFPDDPPTPRPPSEWGPLMRCSIVQVCCSPHQIIPPSMMTMMMMRLKAWCINPVRSLHHSLTPSSVHPISTAHAQLATHPCTGCFLQCKIEIEASGLQQCHFCVVYHPLMVQSVQPYTAGSASNPVLSCVCDGHVSMLVNASAICQMPGANEIAPSSQIKADTPEGGVAAGCLPPHSPPASPHCHRPLSAPPAQPECTRG